LIAGCSRPTVPRFECDERAVTFLNRMHIVVLSTDGERSG